MILIIILFLITIIIFIWVLRMVLNIIIIFFLRMVLVFNEALLLIEVS